jgi:ribose transport system substrate-binding protein
VKKRITPLVLALLLVGALVAGCGGSGSGSKGSTTTAATGGKKTIDVFLYAPRGFNDATKAWANGVDQAAAQLGPKFKVVLKAQGTLNVDPASFVTFIRSAMVERPDGIVVIPNNAQGMAGGVSQIEAQTGVKVLLMDQPIPGIKQVGFVGTNNKNAGAQAAAYLLRQFQQHKLVSNQVAVLRNVPGGTSTDDRLAGFLSALAGSPLKVVATATEPATAPLSQSRSTVTDMLAAHPQLAAVYSVTDVYGLGAAQGLQAAHKLDVQQVSVDATSQGVSAILKHAGMNAEIAQHLKKVGYVSVMTLAKALEGQSVPAVTDTGTTLVTAANAQQYLQQAKADAK